MHPLTKGIRNFLVDALRVYVVNPLSFSRHTTPDQKRRLRNLRLLLIATAHDRNAYELAKELGKVLHDASKRNPRKLIRAAQHRG